MPSPDDVSPSLLVSDIDNILYVNMIPDTSSRGHGARATLYPITAPTARASHHWAAAPHLSSDWFTVSCLTSLAHCELNSWQKNCW